MTERSLVSIVIRTKNRVSMLERALDDLLSQTLETWEAIVVNDGGDKAQVDHLLSVREAPLAGRARAIHLPESGGMEAASNIGIRAATGAYVAIHDDDDTWLPAFLEVTVAHLESTPDALAVAVPTDIVIERAEDDGFVEVERRSFNPPGGLVSLFDMLVTNRVVPIGLLIRREAVDRLGGFDETLEVVGDWEFNLRLLAHGRVDYLPGRVLAEWRQRPAATGSLANSVHAAQAAHMRFDRIVRDRALRDVATHHGLGTPLFVARLVHESEHRMLEHLDRRFDEVVRRFDQVEAQLHERLNAMEGALEGQVRYNSFGAWVRRFSRRLTGWAPK